MSFQPRSFTIENAATAADIPVGEEQEVLASDRRLLSPVSFLLFIPRAMRLMSMNQYGLEW